MPCVAPVTQGVSCMNMKYCRIILLSLLLVGCSPIPVHYACETPRFILTIKSKEISYFDANGYFEKYCHEGVPEQFRQIIDENTNVTVRVRGEWIDLKPMKNGEPFKLQGEGVRNIDFEGYTQAVRVDSIVDSTLSLSTPGNEQVNIEFSIVKCTCVTYDAI